MQKMWRQLFAAVLGVVALSSVASAQNPAPRSYQMVMPQAMPVPAKAAAASNPITPVAGAIYMRGSGGCSSCGNGATAAPAPSFAQYGPQQRNGCGSACADAKFIFGSCKSFFDPCDAGGRGRGCAGCSSCPSWPLAQPYGTKFHGCVYDTYLNH